MENTLMAAEDNRQVGAEENGREVGVVIKGQRGDPWGHGNVL